MADDSQLSGRLARLEAAQADLLIRIGRMEARLQEARGKTPWLGYVLVGLLVFAVVLGIDALPGPSPLDRLFR